MQLEGIRKDVFLDRYSLKDEKGNPIEETPQEMWRRVARGVAKAEKQSRRAFWEEKFYHVMEDFKFVPGGRVLAGAGTGYAVTFFNCFVIPSPPDSRDGILDNLKAMIEIMARGGGVGINLSSLRPRGARVKKVNGFSSGPCNWAEMYSLATHDIIQQGGSRRGALMIMLWDWHPDIEEFITVKQDLSRINGANLSVCASDAFMEAVKNDSDWDLVFPDLDDPEYDEQWDGILSHWKELGKKVIHYKTVKARHLWDLICNAAWRSAEPGLVFMERYNKWYNNWYWNTVNCVNPCVTGDTLITTKKGYTPAKDLKVGDEIFTPKGFRPIKKFYNNGIQQIYRVRFSDGKELSATADHKLKVIKKGGKQEWVKVVDLKEGDKVFKLLFLGSTDERGKGNEDECNKDEKHHNHHEVLCIKPGNIDSSVHSFAFLANTRLRSQKESAMIIQNNTATQSILSRSIKRGGITAKASTTWPTSAAMSESFLNSERVNRSLSIVDFPRTNHIIHDGESSYLISYEVVSVACVEDTERFEEVFDVYEPETLTWVTDGYVSLDCGEEGLPAWGVCNLASLNLSAFVKGDSVDTPGEMDYEMLAEHARIAVRFQDDVVDVDQYIFPEIEMIQKKGERRIGLGTMGLGDALIKMHLRYGSEESLVVVDKIYRTIRDAAYDESVNVAKEKGPFPKINIKKHLKGYFIQHLPDAILRKMKKYGVRNSMLLQAAPTGTTSLLTGVSSGIEPVYEFEFIRKSRLGEHKMYHPLYDAWRLAHPNEPRPAYFVSANDLTPEDHVRVQAAIQKRIDASISKTVNAPNAHTVEDVKKLYMLAYEWGCKGITYMRDGSRQGVLQRVKDEEKKEEKKEDALAYFVPRPTVVEGATYQAESPVGKTYITINHHEGKPFEVFITNGKSGSDVAAMSDALGRIISILLRLNSTVPARERMRKIVSELSGLGGARSIGFGENRVRSLPDAVAKVIARYCGFAVNGQVEDKVPSSQEESRNGVAVDESSAVEQLALDASVAALEGSSSFTTLFDLCPECGAGSLAYEEGCQKCYGCGYSEC